MIQLLWWRRDHGRRMNIDIRTRFLGAKSKEKKIK
jgi:hypothetical protein